MPLYFLIIASVINVVLDIVFIAICDMGVAGAAYATVVSQMVSGILCLIYILRKVPALQLEKKHFRFDPMCCGKQIKLGIPMALQFSITAFGTIVTQTALNTFGSTIVASYVVAGKIEQIINQPYDALGVTIATYSAQNWGVRDLKRLQKGCRIANTISVVYSVLIFLIINPLVPYLVRLFVSGDAVAITKYARIYVFIGTSFFIPLGMIMIFRNMLQSCDFALLPMLGGAVELAGRVGAAFFAVHFHSYVGVCFSNASAWFFAGNYLMIAYLVVMGRIKRRQASVGIDPHG